jgi:Spy/CpxP family protein refolding chaperone
MPARALPLFAALAWLAAPAGAQQAEGPRPWWGNPLIEGLSLTDAQRKEIQSITGDFRSRLLDARTAVDRAENDFAEIFKESSVEERRGEEAIERLAKARGDLTRVLSQMSLKLRAVLTAEQWEELQRRERGRGGPPGFRPGGPKGGLSRPGGPRRGTNPPGRSNSPSPGGSPTTPTASRPAKPVVL